MVWFYIVIEHRPIKNISYFNRRMFSFAHHNTGRSTDSYKLTGILFRVQQTVLASIAYVDFETSKRVSK